MKRIAIGGTGLWLGVALLAALASGCGGGATAPSAPTENGASATAAATATAASDIAIDIQSGESKTTIHPGETASVPLDSSGRVDVTVHFARALSEAEQQSIHVDVDSPKWEVEVASPPAEDSAAFILKGATPAALNVRVAGMTDPPSIRFTVRVSSPVARLPALYL